MEKHLTSKALFGHLILKKRKQMRLTQEYVAGLLGISVQHYRKIEHGICETSYSTALNLFDILKITLEEMSEVTEIIKIERAEKAETEESHAI